METPRLTDLDNSVNPYAPPNSSESVVPSPVNLETLIKLVLVAPVLFVGSVFAVVIIVAVLVSIAEWEAWELKISGLAILVSYVMLSSLKAAEKRRLPVRELTIGVVVGFMIYWC
jgi:hypothetical protein